METIHVFLESGCFFFFYASLLILLLFTFLRRLRFWFGQKTGFVSLNKEKMDIAVQTSKRQVKKLHKNITLAENQFLHVLLGE